MKTENSETQTTADLGALAAAAHGRPVLRQVPGVLKQTEVAARAERVEELRARFKAGELVIDEKALVAKLLDSLFERPLPKPSDG